MGIDRISYSRAIYGVWDFLGDVGGLYDMLRLLAEPILAIISVLVGSGLDRFLIRSLFKKEKNFRLNEDVFSHIKHRKPTKVKWCNLLCDLRNKKRHMIAESRIAKELDIVKFLKH